MITLEAIDGPAFIFRVCPVDDGSGSPPFVASGFLRIDGSTATIKALHGQMPIPLIKELVSTLRPDGYLSCDLVALEQRFLKPKT